MLPLLLVRDGFSGQSWVISHDRPEMMLCIKGIAILRIALIRPALLFVVEDSFDVVCQLVEGLFPTAACA